jgi:hypothetical protein
MLDERTRRVGLARTGAAVMLACGLLASGFGFAPVAQAAGVMRPHAGRPGIPHDLTGIVRAGLGLTVRSGRPSGPVLDTMPDGSTVRLHCWAPGPWVDATWGGHTWSTNHWDTVLGFTTPSGDSVVYGPSVAAIAADAWIDTGGRDPEHCPDSAAPQPRVEEDR